MKAYKKLVFLCIVGLFLLTSIVLAYGGINKPEQGLSISIYVLLVWVILFILFLTFYVRTKKLAHDLKNSKKKEERIKQHEVLKHLKLLKWGWILSILGMVITGSLSFIGEGWTSTKGVYLEHVHGLGYSTDGKRVILAAHDGLKMYEGGNWKNVEDEKNDYMGFSAVDNGFYSSGHPAPGSDKKNPLGIVKSTDEGKTLQTLDLYGQIDFHMMAVGYKSHTIYVINPESNERMKATGLYYSTDDTKTWTKSAMNGINEEPTTLTVHPSNEAIVAIGTQTGVYLSKDFGQNFEKILSKGQVTSLFFTNDALFVGGYDNNQAYLLKLNSESKQSNEIIIPKLSGDAVAYFAVNPVTTNEMIFSTYKKDIYISNDNGEHWRKIADKGKGVSEKNNN